MGDEQPKIHVDDDWKRQAQKEKQELASGAGKSERQEAALGGGPLPEASFSSLVNMLAAQALLYLGEFPVSEDGKTMVNLEMAKHHIDTLQILEDKTKGNLSEQEKDLLARALYELRMRYVQGPSAATGNP